MTVHDGYLVVGGPIFEIDGVLTPNIAIWNGATWFGVANGPNGSVYSLTSWDGAIIVGGPFTIPAAGIARFDGATWWASSLRPPAS